MTTRKRGILAPSQGCLSYIYLHEMCSGFVFLAVPEQCAEDNADGAADDKHQVGSVPTALGNVSDDYL
jgi:hypothetical protein